MKLIDFSPRFLLLLLFVSLTINIYLISVETIPHDYSIQQVPHKRHITWQFPFINEDDWHEPDNTTKRPYPFYDVSKMGDDVAQCFIDYCQSNKVHEDVAFIGKNTVGCSNGDRQDMLLFSSLWKFPLRRGGVVVEIGGMTGWEASNSLFLEKCLGWKAIIFELTPINYAHLRKNRPNTITIHGTVCKEVSFVYVPKEGFGCCSSAFSANETRLENDPSYVKVPCKPMTAWLKDYNVTAVDYLSLDTEGYELTILESIDWNYNSIHAVSIEMLQKNLLTETVYNQNKRIRVLLNQLQLAYIPWLSLSTNYNFNRDDVWVNQSWII